MRCLLDANIIISVLLGLQTGSAPPTPVLRVMELGFQGVFQPLVLHQTLQEIENAITVKTYLRHRIPFHAFEQLRDVLIDTDMMLNHPDVQGQPILRDVKDDYLVLNARDHNVDVLISSDKDVLAHKEDEPFLILSPAAFIDFLAIRGLLPPDEI